jgi:hypothetical protein
MFLRTRMLTAWSGTDGLPKTVSAIQHTENVCTTSRYKKAIKGEVTDDEAGETCGTGSARGGAFCSYLLRARCFFFAGDVLGQALA